MESRWFGIAGSGLPHGTGEKRAQNQPMPSKEGLHLPKDYGGEAGVQDVAEEVSRLRRKGIWVISVFTGNDRDLPAAHKIYGRELARIRSVSWFADTVGRLIQERIREM